MLKSLLRSSVGTGHFIFGTSPEPKSKLATHKFSYFSPALLFYRKNQIVKNTTNEKRPTLVNAGKMLVLICV